MKEVSVREFLDRTRVTQDFLSKKVGCTQMCVSSWANEKTHPKGLYKKELIKVMNKFGYTLK